VPGAVALAEGFTVAVALDDGVGLHPLNQRQCPWLCPWCFPLWDHDVRSLALATLSAPIPAMRTPTVIADTIAARRARRVGVAGVRRPAADLLLCGWLLCI